jgi:hypothetical protein
VIEETRPRKSPAILVQDRISSSADKKESLRDDFLKKFKEEVDIRFRLKKDALKNRSETSLKVIDSEKKLPTKEEPPPKDPMKDSLLGENDQPVAVSRSSSAPKPATSKNRTLLSRVDFTAKLSSIHKTRINKLPINKFSFSKKEADSNDQQSSKPVERSLAESQSVNTPLTPNHVTFSVQANAMVPSSDKPKLRDQIYE